MQLLPVLLQLNSHQIRSRHWIQVMQVTTSNFQLESSQMRLCHLLDCNLLKYVEILFNNIIAIILYFLLLVYSILMISTWCTRELYMVQCTLSDIHYTMLITRT